MVYDEDATLLSFFERSLFAIEAETLKRNVISYASNGVTQKLPAGKSSISGDTIPETNDATSCMSSPMDSVLASKKRRARLEQKSKTAELDDGNSNLTQVE